MVCGIIPETALLGDRCCGCGACIAVCKFNAVHMTVDKFGFNRPKFDPELCMNCGACIRACVALGNPLPDSVLATYWAKASDDALREQSSSGGIFGILAHDTLLRGGTVCGARWYNKCTTLRHSLIESENDLDNLMRSKYLQSSIDIDVYERVRNKLENKAPVLFCGTACQIAGLRGYLNGLADDSNLLLVDVICHGVPSPLLWRKWLEHCSLSAKSQIDEVNFRDKRTGWISFSISYEGTDGTVCSSAFSSDWYMRAFLANASLRSSCFCCPAKRKCGSDVTLGDYWGIQSAHPDVDFKDGVSAVIINTKRGMTAVNAIKKYLDFGTSSFDKVLSGNSALTTSVTPFHAYESFMRDIANDTSIKKLMDCYPFDFPNRRLRKLLSQIKAKIRKMLSIYSFR